MDRREFLATAAGAAASLATGWMSCEASNATAADSATTHVVNIEAMQYSPAALTIKRGERVRWINKDPFPHTVTAEGGAFHSRDIQPEASFTYTAHKAGQFAYGCALHLSMKAMLVVT